jgi:DNA / pantothenate metabolism flavoprotein
MANTSYSKMGFALACVAGAPGVPVTVVSGSLAVGTPNQATRVHVRAALVMQDAMEHALPGGGHGQHGCGGRRLSAASQVYVQTGKVEWWRLLKDMYRACMLSGLADPRDLGPRVTGVCA